jgi:hypothetical protein
MTSDRETSEQKGVGVVEHSDQQLTVNGGTVAAYVIISASPTVCLFLARALADLDSLRIEGLWNL